MTIVEVAGGWDRKMAGFVSDSVHTPDPVTTAVAGFSITHCRSDKGKGKGSHLTDH